jgi:phosphocarrier protein
MNTENATLRKSSDQREPHSAERELTIVNELGLHARPAAEFVRCATQFRSQIFLRKDDKRFSARSMLEILMADLGQGQSAFVEAHGPDADAAVETLADLVGSFRE